MEPYISNPPYFDKESRQWIDPNSPKNFFYSTFVKMPRAMVGLAFEDGSYGKILIDLWDGGEKSRDAYKQVRTLQQINTLENLTLSSALTYTERLEQAKKLKTVSKFSKGVGIFGITISVVDFSVNVSNAIDAFNKGNSKKGWNSVAKGVGSIGEILISTGVILGPTLPGAICTVAGTILWVGSAIYVHREGIKKAVTGAVNWAKDTGGKIVDGTKKVVGGIANGTKKLLNKISWW